MDSILYIVFLITGLIAGGLAGWYFAKSKFNIPAPFAAEDFVQLSNEKMLLEQKLTDLRTMSEELKRETFSARERNTAQTIEISRLDTVNKSLNEKLQSQKSELEELQKKIKEQFENIASKII